ncbi:MAG: DUF2490 domain-containing protein [Cytophagales bacterium]|nr:DUF2490 domain-containing protein [Cytophagales bacterium]
MKKRFLIFFLLLPSLLCASDGTLVRNMFWNELYILGKIHPKWDWQMELHYRRVSDPYRANIVQNPYQHLYRPWVHYTPFPWLRLSVSPISLAITYSYSKGNLLFEPELRLSVQAMLIHRYFEKLTIHHRFRYEYRAIGRKDIHQVGEFDYEDNYIFPVSDSLIENGSIALQKTRARYMLRFILPLGNHTKLDPDTWYLTGWNETYFNFGPTVGSNDIFDQNRFFLLLGYKLKSEFPMRVEVGYGLRTASRYAYSKDLPPAHTTEFDNIFQIYFWFENVNCFFKKCK